MVRQGINIESLFTIREDIVYVLFVRHTSQALLTGDEIGDED